LVKQFDKPKFEIFIQEERTMLHDFSKDVFDIIIQAGQSNAEGCGVGDTDAPYTPSDLVWYLNPDMTVTTAAEKAEGNCIRTNFSLPFAAAYLRNGRLAEGRKLLILRTAVGGTGFLDKRWGMTDDLYLRMMDMIRTALALNPANRLVAFLWHQGETDACLNATRDGHYANLTGLIQSIRDTFAVPDLPFVAGDFVYHWRDENAAVCAPVLEAICAVCNHIGRAAFVETDGLKSNWQELGDIRQDPIHFSRRATYTLGERYYEAFAGIVQ
jgi:hypothetical protein